MSCLILHTAFFATALHFLYLLLSFHCITPFLLDTTSVSPLQTSFCWLSTYLFKFFHSSSVQFYGSVSWATYFFSSPTNNLMLVSGNSSILKHISLLEFSLWITWTHLGASECMKQANNDQTQFQVHNKLWYLIPKQTVFQCILYKNDRLLTSHKSNHFHFLFLQSAYKHQLQSDNLMIAWVIFGMFCYSSN
jgi:hypothetical protein